MAPSQPMSAPPKVSRQPSSQPAPRCGECGHRRAICAGSMLLPYAAYNSTGDKRTSARPRSVAGRPEDAPSRLARLVATEWGTVSQPRADVAILGGGPGGYEAALVAAQLGARVTVVEADGLGGACVLTDCVPSKTLIATSETMGILAGSHAVVVDGREISAGVVLLATGGVPRQLPGAEPDGERILNWRQLYDLAELPGELVVVGSGVTGAEFASAYQALGSQVTLISSRDRVLPHEDQDAAMVVEDVFRRRGMTVLSRSRADGVKREGNGIVVTLADGRTVRGSHCLLTVGLVPAT